MPDLPLFKSRYSVPLHFLFELKKAFTIKVYCNVVPIMCRAKHCYFKPSCIPPWLVANSLGVAVSTAQAAHV